MFAGCCDLWWAYLSDWMVYAGDSDHSLHSRRGALCIFAWIGYTLATTPPPKPVEDIEGELEKDSKEIGKKTVEEAALSG